VFAFPSIREFGGAVALEAMACGVPAIVPAYGGLGELVTDETGWLLPMGVRSELIERLRTTLESIVNDPNSIDNRGKCARDRVFEKFTWDVKARSIVEVWKTLL
ncbi:MAG TPA: glycosyltransferase, partial [Tepidisphaeraceae bacterium]|nr:glycosyltransferase [Tepidisphaeraceae bacterium]